MNEIVHFGPISSVKVYIDEILEKCEGHKILNLYCQTFKHIVIFDWLDINAFLLYIHVL